MVSPSKLRSSVVLATLLSQMFVVWSGQMDSLMARIIVRVRKRRSENWDFTQLNQNVCPPSLCRSLDEVTGETKDRPKGTGGTVFYQGDIVLDKKMGRFIYPQSKTSRRQKRATMRRRSRLWRSGVVVYKMSRSISDEAKAMFERAINHIQKRTCIKFRQKEDKDKDFIRFISEPGCWSQIGRVGGVQMVSLGRGCESLGTAVHELVHALGIWHEQARPDRDKFVEIIEDNISEKFMPDFEVVSSRVSTARGYPYDYQSLMHYSKFAFTKNGKPTIKVIGVGEKLKMRIGQRRGLSTIDLAQLRDMYKCNQAVDANETVCHKDWVKLKGTCYKFFPDTKAQFGPASSTCYDLKSHLLTIDTRQEQKVITRYLNKKFNSIKSWRTAGKRVNNIMMWYLGPSTARNITRYTNWAKGHPGVYTSAILIRDDSGDAFEWKGEWSGSSSQKPAYEHAFICEKTAKRKCINGKFPDGQDYRGKLDHTRDGYTCQRWTENYPHQHKLVEAAKKGAMLEAEEDSDGLGNHNWCRNPSGLRRNRPWCFTAKAKHEWGYCDVSICAKSSQSQKQSTEKVKQWKGRSGTQQLLRSRLYNRRRGNTLRHKTRHKKTPSTVTE